MIMSGMNRRNDVWCVGRDGKRKVMKWDYGLEMVELIVKRIMMVRELILDGFEDGKFNCCCFSLLAWNIKKLWYNYDNYGWIDLNYGDSSPVNSPVNFGGFSRD